MIVFLESDQSNHFQVKMKKEILSPTTFPQPYVAETVSIGDLCAFRNKNCFRIGKILNFANYTKNSGKQYLLTNIK